MGEPARGYSWAPFKPGNDVGQQFQPGHELSTIHGGYSPRKYDPLARELVVDLVALAAAIPELGYLAEPQYRLALWAWARTEARVQLVHEWLIDQGGDLDDDGEVRAAANLLNQLETSAERKRARLGLDPLSRAQLGRDVAAGSLDMARILERLGVDDRKAGDDGP